MPGVLPFSSQAPRAKSTPSSTLPTKGSHSHSAGSPIPTVSMWLSKRMCLGPSPIWPTMFPWGSNQVLSKLNLSISACTRSPTSRICESIEGIATSSRMKRMMSS